jgi:hypothetical protein
MHAKYEEYSTTRRQRNFFSEETHTHTFSQRWKVELTKHIFQENAVNAIDELHNYDTKLNLRTLQIVTMCLKLM